MVAMGADPVPLGAACARTSLERFHQGDYGHLGRVPGQQVHVIIFPIARGQDGAKVAAHLPEHVVQIADVLAGQHTPPVFRHQDQVNMEGGNDTSALAVVFGGCHRPGVVYGSVLVRYRYRLRPTRAQKMALARMFGCARVVYNDSLRLREDCHVAGEKISDSEVQRRVITLAKLTPERAWLAEAPSVALVQACNDARRAYRNWFNSRSGRRKGRKMGHPVFRRKRGRQSARLTRNGFSLHGQRLYVAKAGELRVRWSRPLPSEPSSVTVIHEPDGRYYASFVVERATTPLPPCGREVGVDVGLGRLAATSDGEIIPNPRFLRAKEHHLAKAQRALSRKAKGSVNRAKARRRVAVVHRRVRETRLDHAHKIALALVRDNQAVYAEDLAVYGLARTRLATSVHDAGWAQLLHLIGEKAQQYGRTFHRIGRFTPTSQTCSVCGVKDGPKPLGVRCWRCGVCGTMHDRDVNAARNVLAAGRAERLNACGGTVRPGVPLAGPSETGTHRGAAWAARQESPPSMAGGRQSMRSHR
jgi:putative transposase